MPDFETVDDIAGFTANDIGAMVAEAEVGHDLSRARVVPNPHYTGSYLVPEDLKDALVSRALQEHKSPEQVIREALEAYFRAA